MNEIEVTEVAQRAVAQVQERSAATTPHQLLALAVQQGASLDQLERLMALQERFEANEARKAYADAFAAFKSGEPIHIQKDKRVKFTTQKGTTEYTHATIGNVVKVLTEALGRYGFSHAWNSKQDRQFVTIECSLRHRSGHHESVSMSAEIDTSGSKNHIQAIGSTVTYLQRYTLLAITGCATTDQPDDDGAAGGRREQQAAQKMDDAPQALIDQAELAAGNGTAFYADWWSTKLTTEQRKSVGADRHNRFKKIAAHADQQGETA